MKKKKIQKKHCKNVLLPYKLQTMQGTTPVITLTKHPKENETSVDSSSQEKDVTKVKIAHLNIQIQIIE